MGVCLSRCGDKQAPPVAEAAATEQALETKTTAAESPYNPNHSLKRFLHLNQEPQKSWTSTPRTSSLVESANIPHSGELFSLPGSDPELRSSFALSPALPPSWPPSRAPSRAPSDGASISSHITVNSLRKGCSKKRIRPSRGEQVDLAAHQGLVDAIARLERLNEAGKSSIFGIRGSSICSSDVAVSAKSSSGELYRPAMRGRHVRHYQLPLEKSTTCSSKNTAPDMATAAVSHPPMGNLVSLDTTPAVTDFLRTVETFVSLIEAPREPKATVPTTVTNRHGFEDTDSEEMFTFEFGASGVRNQSKQSPVRTETVSLQRLVQSATEASCGQKSPIAEAVAESATSSSSTWQPIELFVKQSGAAGRTVDARVPADPGVKPLREEEGAIPRPAQDRNVVALRKAKSPRFTLGMRDPKRLMRGRLSRSLDSIESSVIHVDLEIIRNRDATPIAASPSKHLTEAATLIDAKRTELELMPVSSTWSCKLKPSGCEQKLELEENSCTGFLDTSTAELGASEILPPQEVVSLVEDPTPSIASAESSPREPAGNLDRAPEAKKMRCEETLPTLEANPSFLTTNWSDRTTKVVGRCQKQSKCWFPDQFGRIIQHSPKSPLVRSDAYAGSASERTKCTGSQAPPIVTNHTDSDFSDSNSSEGLGDSQRFGLSEAFHSLLKLLLFSSTEPAGATCALANSVTLDPDEENQYGVLPRG